MTATRGASTSRPPARTVFFVHQKDIGGVIEKARAGLEERAGFRQWRQAEAEGELRCEMAWPDDPERRAEVAVFFVYLPK